ncbi:MAG: hypothetical protein IPL35_01910 [Sphingobacteriales bacterium]|nr:hypothetical protein [Sphingobacteriales bacterium]
MTLADKLLEISFPKFPHFKSEFKWSSYTLEELAINKFSNFKEVEFRKNFIVYVGAPNDNENDTENYIKKMFDGIAYKDKNRSGDYEKDFDTKLANIRLFISHDGAYLLENYEKTAIDKDEIAIFLEIPKNDIFSDNVFLIKAGENAKQYAESILAHKWTQDKYILSKEQITELLETISTGKIFWDKVVSTINSIENFVIDSITNIGISALDTITDFFSKKIRIDEKTWNSGHSEYSLEFLEKNIVAYLYQKHNEIKDFVKNNNTILPNWAINIIESFGKIIENIIIEIVEIKEEAENLWAFICGLWNGLMDLISDIFTLLNLLFQGVKLHNSYQKNEGYYKSLVSEYLDNVLQALANLDWKTVIKKGVISFIELKQYIYYELPEQLYEKLQNLNTTELNYYEGYIVFNIVEFLLPPLKIAKLSKTSKSEKVVDLLEEIIANANKITKPIKKESQEVAELFFQTINGFIGILIKGADEVSKFIDEFNDAIKRWLREIFGLASEKRILDDVDKGKIKLDEKPDGSKRHPNDQTRYASYSEIKARWFLENHTFQIGTQTGKLKYISINRINDLDTPIRQGIDGVYQFSNQPPKYVIVEVKMNTKENPKWNPKVDTAKTASGSSQMTDVWIDYNLDIEFGQAKALAIGADYIGVLIGVSKTYEPILKVLDKNAKPIHHIFKKK